MKKTQLNRKQYAKLHSFGSKSNFEWRLSVMDRAQEAGIDEIAEGEHDLYL